MLEIDSFLSTDFLINIVNFIGLSIICANQIYIINLLTKKLDTTKSKTNLKETSKYEWMLEDIRWKNTSSAPIWSAKIFYGNFRHY